MINHHPDATLLAEYASGSMSLGQSMGIAAHLHYCEQCRRQVRQLNQLGGALLESATRPVAPEPGALDNIMAQIENRAAGIGAPPSQPVDSASPALDRLQKCLPPVVAKLVGNPASLKWQRLSPSMKMTNLKTGQSQCQVSLIKIAAGGRVLEHNHRGNEFTIVLKGAFSDNNGVYQAGDFLHNQPGEVHTPCATTDADCLCFTILDAPLKFTGVVGKLINPMIRLNPS